MKLHRYSTSLSEAQAAVAQVRQWIDQGVELEKIALVAPQIEEVWPVLYEYLDQEGIPYDKAVVTKALFSSEAQSFLAQMKLRAGLIDRAVVEQLAYSAGPLLSYQEFDQRLGHFYGPHQLQLDPRLKSLLEVPMWTEEALSFGEFVDEVLPLLKGDIVKWISPTIERGYNDVPSTLLLPRAKWLEYLERLLTKAEVTLQEAHPRGIRVLGLSASDWINADHVWLMGLTEESLKRFEPMGLTVREVLSLSADVGFQLSWPDQRHNEFEALWLMQRGFEEFHLSTSATDFSGQAQAASLIWLEQSLKQQYSHDTVELAPATRLRELQRARIVDVETPLSLDIERWTWIESTRLSATQIENYLECPFVFAAQKLLRLKDEPALDLDMDAMAKGQFQHALFEALTEEPFRSEWAEENLKSLIQSLRRSGGIRTGEAALWPAFERRYMKMAQDFLRFEKLWRERFPKTRVLARELEIRAVWNVEQRKFLKDGEGIPFYGRIDRVDGQNGQNDVVLLDYKSSSANLRHWQKWLENRELQMGLYTLAVEDGVTDLGPREVAAAFYYVLRSEERHKGFRVSETDESFELFPRVDRIRNWIGREEKMQLLDELRETVNAVVARMRSGDFAPFPADPQTCPSCRWKELCRAPHL